MRRFKKLLAVVLSISLTIGVGTGIQAQTGQNVTGIQEKNVTQEQEPLLQVSGSNSLGNSIAGVMEETIEERADSEYYISGIEVTGKHATVNYSAMKDCTLVLAVYDDAGTVMQTSATATLAAVDVEAVVDFDISEMPETFLVKGFLLDTKTKSPMAQAYIEDTYTAEFQSFLSKTTEDFEEEKVLNLDEDIDSNFAVFREETLQIKENETTNKLVSADEEKGIYVIDNPQADFLQAAAGDEIYYEAANGVYLINVKKIEQSENRLTITGAEPELEDVFSYIKLEANQENAEITTDSALRDEGISYLGTDVEDVSGSGMYTQGIDAAGEIETPHWSFAIKKELKGSGNVTAKGTVEGKVTIFFKGKAAVYYNGLRMKISCTIMPNLEGKVSASGELEAKLPFDGLTVTIYKIVNISLTPAVVLRAEGELAAKVTLEGSLGAAWDSKSGFKNKSELKKVETSVEAEGTLFVGISLEAKINVIADALGNLKMTGECGGEAKGTIEFAKVGAEADGHLCEKCLDGELNYIAKLTASASAFNELFEAKAEILKLTKKAGNFWYSFTYGDGGFGTCPHVKKGESDSDEKDIVFDETAHGVVIGSGQCGENVFWKQYEDGMVYVYGSGRMYDNYLDISKDEIVKSVYIEDDVTNIGWGSFSYCSNLKNIRIPEGVTDIAEKAFCGCTKLKKISFPSSLQYIHQFAFNNCSGLLILKFPDNLSNVGHAAFGGCSSLTSITIPTSMKNTGYETFYGCVGLESVIISNGVTEIAHGTFENCSRLSNITIPSSVTSIHDDAFSGCPALTIQAPSGSYAETYAQENNIPFIATVEPVRLTGRFMSAVNTTIQSATVTQEVVKTDAEAGTDYLLIVVKDANAENFLAADNLLYIDQKTADDKGKVAFSYQLKEQGKYTERFVKAAFTQEENPEEPENPTEGLLGDANGDDNVTLVDANLVLKAALKIISLTEEQQKRADANKDRAINLQDANLILKVALRIIIL